MKFLSDTFFCSPTILKYIDEISEIEECISAVPWKEEFSYTQDGKTYMHQAAYNKAFDAQFRDRGWCLQPQLHSDHPKLIGDYVKNSIFVELQFGNSATVFRDYYKFHYGLSTKQLTIAVLIVPTKPSLFFPTRASSVNNMAEFSSARSYYDLLPIPVPIYLIGLEPSN